MDERDLRQTTAKSADTKTDSGDCLIDTKQKLLRLNFKFIVLCMTLGLLIKIGVCQNCIGIYAP